MSAGSGAVRRFAGPVGGVSLDVERITGGGLQVPDDLLQSHLTDGLLVLHFHWVCRRNGRRRWGWARVIDGERALTGGERRTERAAAAAAAWG